MYNTTKYSSTPSPMLLRSKRVNPTICHNTKNVINNKIIKRATPDMKSQSLKSSNKKQTQNLSETDQIKEENLKLKKIINQLEYESSLVKDKLNIMTNSWLADEVFTKYFDIIMMKLIDSDKSIYLMNPIITNALKNINDFNDYLDPIKLNNKKYLIMAINDSTDLEKQSGSHWSVLVFNRVLNKFYHYDSKEFYNWKHAETVAIKLAKYFGLNTCPEIITLKGPLQHNSYDCGIYALAAIDCIIKNIDKDIETIKFQKLDDNECMKKRCYLACIMVNGASMSKDLLLSLMTNVDHLNITNTNRNKLNSFDYYENSMKNDNTWKKVPVKHTNNKSPGHQIRSSSIQLNNKFNILSELNEELSTCSVYVPHHSSLNESLKTNKCRPTRMKPRGRKQHRVLLLADSHGRRCGSLLHEKLGDKFEVISIFKPNASWNNVVKDVPTLTKDFNEKDYVILMGGSNDMHTNEDSTLKQLPDSLLNLDIILPLVKNTNLIIPNIPHRFDKPALNYKIRKSNQIRNQVINCLAKENSNMLLIRDNCKFYRRDHTKHGLHYNFAGKDKLCSIISDIIHKNVKHHTLTSTAVIDRPSFLDSTLTSPGSFHGFETLDKTTNINTTSSTVDLSFESDRLCNEVTQSLDGCFLETNKKQLMMI